MAPGIEPLVSLLSRRSEILEAYLFGSRARGDASAHSDVDVAVYVDRTAVPDAPFGYVAALTTELIRALGRNDVDVVVLNDAPPLLYHRVLRDGRRLVSRDLVATTRREGYALSRYCDYVPQLRKIEAAQRRADRGRDLRTMSPGRPDRDLVLRHLHALDEALTALRAHRGRPIADLQKDRHERWIVERGLQLCTQNVLDVATHLAASSGHDVPDYASALDRLQELRVLPPEFVQRFRGIAGFRNVLVHGYLDVDLRVLHTVLEERFEDFGTFARLVRRYLDDPPPAGT